MFDQLSWDLIQKIQPSNGQEAILTFATEILGMPGLTDTGDFVHTGQINWVRGSNKVINYLKPANQWGKTAITAIKHIYQCVMKAQLHGRVVDRETWRSIRYETLNFGKTYEIARGVLESAIDICEGNFLLPTGKTNESLLKGWAITQVVDNSAKPPEIVFWNNSHLLIRSYDDLGSAFKRKKIAFASGDECGDIPELRLFVTGTLLPRLSFYRGQLDLIGTPQPKGLEYEEMGAEAQKEMLERGPESDQFFYTGSVYENPFLPRSFVKKIESVADPELRKQIIFGQYVDWTEHFFSFDEISQMFVDEIDWNEETGISEYPDPNGCYIMSVDLAATSDETVASCVRYNRFLQIPNGRSIELPYKIVFHKGFVGRTIPLSMQYELIKSWFMIYRNVCPRTRFVFDGNSLGGKNSEEAFADLHGSPFPPKGVHIAKAKAESMGAFKEVLGRNRRIRTVDGKAVDEVPNWGHLRASSKITKLRKQMEGYRMDDKAIKQDRVVSVAQAIHYIERRKPNLSRTKAIDI